MESKRPVTSRLIIALRMSCFVLCVYNAFLELFCLSCVEGPIPSLTSAYTTMWHMPHSKRHCAVCVHRTLRMSWYALRVYNALRMSCYALRVYNALRMSCYALRVYNALRMSCYVFCVYSALRMSWYALRVYLECELYIPVFGKQSNSTRVAFEGNSVRLP